MFDAKETVPKFFNGHFFLHTLCLHIKAKDICHAGHIVGRDQRILRELPGWKRLIPGCLGKRLGMKSYPSYVAIIVARVKKVDRGTGLQGSITYPTKPETGSWENHRSLKKCRLGWEMAHELNNLDKRRYIFQGPSFFWVSMLVFRGVDRVRRSTCSFLLGGRSTCCMLSFLEMICECAALLYFWHAPNCSTTQEAGGLC